MTCAFGLALPGLGLVCADTRVNFADEMGRPVHHDYGDVLFEGRDSRRIEIKASYRKIRPYLWGWATGAGTVLLLEAGFSSLGQGKPIDIKQIEQLMIAAYHGEDPDGFTNEGKTCLLIVRQVNTDFQLDSICFRQDPIPPNSQFALVTPSELTHDQNHAIHAQFQSSLIEAVHKHDLFTMIRLLAETFHTVHRVSTSVSDRVEIGFTATALGGMQKSYLSADNAWLRSASNEQITNIIKHLS